MCCIGEVKCLMPLLRVRWSTSTGSGCGSCALGMTQASLQALLSSPSLLCQHSGWHASLWGRAERASRVLVPGEPLLCWHPAGNTRISPSVQSHASLSPSQA